jgi:hypothetical protein
MSALRWTEPQHRDYQARRVQLPLGRGVKGLDRPRRINTSALEWVEAEALMRWASGYWVGRPGTRVWVVGEGLLAYPELEWFYPVPNGGWRSWKVANALQRQGVKPGVWDYNLDVARQGYHGLRIELKRQAGGGLSAEQKRWGEGLSMNGYLAVVCRGWEAARDRLVDYLST